LTKEWRQENAPRTKCAERQSQDAVGLPKLPRGWAWAKVGQLGNVSGGLTKNADREGHPLKLPYLRVANVREAHVDLSNLRTIGIAKGEIGRTLLKTGDLLFVEGNGSPDQIGRVAIWNGSIDRCVHQNHIIKVRFDSVQMAEWLLIWFMSPHGRSAIRRVASSTSGLHTLSIGKISILPVPLPTSAEIAEALNLVKSHLEVMQLSSVEAANWGNEINRLRQAVLTAAFRGKLAPQDTTDEPATILLERLRAEKVESRSQARGRAVVSERQTPPRKRQRVLAQEKQA
jgi:type I restriction enzyme, S subunit